MGSFNLILLVHMLQLVLLATALLHLFIGFGECMLHRERLAPSFCRWSWVKQATRGGGRSCTLERGLE